MTRWSALALVGVALAGSTATTLAWAQQQQDKDGDFYELGDYSYFEPQPIVAEPVRPIDPTPEPHPVPAPSPSPAPAPTPIPSAPSTAPTPTPAAGGGGSVPIGGYTPGSPATYPQGDMAGARADANAFGKAQRSASGSITTSTDLTSIPGYSSTPLPEETLFDDPDSLTSQGASAALANDPWRTVTNPDRTVVVLDPDSLTRAKAVEQDPEAYLEGQSLGAADGSCQPLPPSSTGTEYYEAMCNQGAAVVDTPRSCSIRMEPETTSVTAYKYFSVPDNAYGTPLARYSAIAPYVSSGVCRPTGVSMVACAAHRIWGTSTNKFCDDYRATEYVCSADLNIAYADSNRKYPGKSYHEITTTTTVITKRVDGCSGLESDAMCTATSGEVCAEPGETRIINGVAVTEACWAWKRDFTCQSITQASDCSELQNNPQCSYSRDECLDDPQVGACQVTTKVYRCPLPSAPSSEPAQYICGDDVYCINGDCEPIEREASTEFKDALVGLHTLGQANAEFDEATMTLFSGTRETCTKKVFGLSNCCSGKGVPLLTPFLCEAAERELDKKDDKGLCHRVGSYCSDKVLGICVTRKDAYCCFESKLSRILQEQGRIQINKPWGEPKKETCKGFSIAEFQMLDLSVMDFSEVYAEFIDAAKLPDELETTNQIQQRIEAYLNQNGTN